MANDLIRHKRCFDENGFNNTVLLDSELLFRLDTNQVFYGNGGTKIEITNIEQLNIIFNELDKLELVDQQKLNKVDGMASNLSVNGNLKVNNVEYKQTYYDPSNLQGNYTWNNLTINDLYIDLKNGEKLIVDGNANSGKTNYNPFLGKIVPDGFQNTDFDYFVIITKNKGGLFFEFNSINKSNQIILDYKAQYFSDVNFIIYDFLKESYILSETNYNSVLSTIIIPYDYKGIPKTLISGFKVGIERDGVRGSEFTELESEGNEGSYEIFTTGSTSRYATAISSTTFTEFTFNVGVYKDDNTKIIFSGYLQHSNGGVSSNIQMKIYGFNVRGRVIRYV